MVRRLTVTTGLIALTTGACADPCFDDGLLQDDQQPECAVQASGGASQSDSATESESESATESESNSESETLDSESMSASSTDTDSSTDSDTESDSDSDSDSDTESESDSDSDSDTDTGEGGVYCVDADGDGFGDPDNCEDVPDGEDPPDGSVPNGDDCDDSSEFVFPGAAPNDDPEACMKDEDDDDYGDDDPPKTAVPGSDCLDTNPNAFPGSAPNDDPEACMEDADDDDYGDAGPPEGVEPGSDCDDDNEDAPAIDECLVWCLDADDDNFGDATMCVEAPEAPPGYVGNDTDCDDSNPFAFPGAAPNDDAEACMQDVDGDDWGDDDPGDGIDPGSDCDDTNINAFPGAAENELPADACMEDEDDDGWGDSDPPDGVDPGSDCDDTNINAFPGAAPNDDPDACMEDEDGDDWGDDDPPDGVTPGTDCADDNAGAFPGAAENEVPADACMEDEDDDGWGDDDPPDGVTPGSDCADDNANAFPGAAENDDPDACMEDEDDDGWGDDDPPDGVTPGSDCNDMFAGVPVDLTGLPVTCGEAALAQGSLGCEFHAVPLPHIDVGEPIGFDVALSNPSSLFTSVVTIEQFSGGAWNVVAGPFNVTPQSQVQVDLPLNGADTSGIFTGGSYRISSNLPIAAYQRSFQEFSTDASLLLPATTWADDYHVVGWDALEQDAVAGSEEYVTVVSRADGTVVTVTPSQDIVGGPGVPATAAGTPFSVTLDEGEIAVVASLGQGIATANSLTGTTVSASNPVGVFTGSECSRVPAGVTACDHIEEQLLPAANASSRFVASRVTPRNTTTPESAVWQIYALEDVTVSFDASAEVTGLPAGPTALLAGQALELEVSGTVANPGDFIVEADGNILVAEYVTGQNGGGGIGDPAMAQLPAQTQLLSDYAVGTYPGFTVHHLTITRESGSPVILDGVAIPDADFIDVGTTSEYEVARVQVDEGTHILSGDDPFAVLSTGYTNFDSYAYAGGLRTNDLVCTVPKNNE